jgi:O-antigen/teichoic acid export membrane protein
MIKSVFFSFGINFINLLFPLLLIPFFIKNLGIGIYGIIVIVIAIINYVGIITDYSYAILGPIELNKLDNNTVLINNYISKVINTKFFLTLIGSFVLFISLYFYHLFENGFFCVFSIFLMFFSRSQNVFWVFIGLNKINVYFYFYTFFKILSIFLILSFVNTNKDLDLVFFIMGISDTLIIVFSYVFLYIKHDFKYCFTKLNEVYFEFRTGFSQFLTFLSLCSLSNSSALILGVMVKPEVVGIYSVAEKIVMLIKNCTGVLFTALFPKVCSIGTSDLKKLNRFIYLLFKSYILLFIVAALFLFLFSDYIIPFFSKISIEEIKKYLIYLLPVIIISALGQPAYMSLVITEQKNKYSLIYLGALFFNLLASFILCYYFNVYGIVMSLFLTEIFITSFLNYFTLNKFETNFFKNL